MTVVVYMIQNSADLRIQHGRSCCIYYLFSTKGSARGLYGSIRGLCGSIRGLYGSIRGLYGSIRGLYGSIRGPYGSIRVHMAL